MADKHKAIMIVMLPSSIDQKLPFNQLTALTILLQHGRIDNLKLICYDLLIFIHMYSYFQGLKSYWI